MCEGFLLLTSYDASRTLLFTLFVVIVKSRRPWHSDTSSRTIVILCIYKGSPYADIHTVPEQLQHSICLMLTDRIVCEPSAATHKHSFTACY